MCRNLRIVGLTAVLAIQSFDVAADWTPVGKANEIYAAFADKATLRRNGSMATMHGLYDFRKQDFTPEGLGLYSTAVLREYDCAARRVRLMSAIDFSGHMGTGAPVSTSNEPRRWEAVLAGGIDDEFWQTACSAN